MDQKISIIIPVRNESSYIAGCLDSILGSDYHGYSLEILVVDGMSDDGTRGLVLDHAKKQPNIKLLDNEQRTAQFGINIGLKAAGGDYIFILSAHAKYPTNYFYTLVETMKKLNADCVGGVLKTDVKVKNKKSESIKLVLSDILGVGNSAFRVGTDAIKEVDTVAYGCYRRDVFKKYGLFDERLVRNQDIEFNKRIKNRGAKIYITPDTVVTYYARNNFKDLSSNNYGNGYWNILTTYYTGTFRSLNVRHFIPLIFVISVLVPVLLSLIYRPFIYISLFSLAIYFSAIVIRALLIKTIGSSWLFIGLSFFVLHWSYGIGSLMAMLKLTFIKRK